MNDPNTPNTPGQHLGELPEDPAILDSIYAMNAKGWDTTTSSNYAAMIAQGIEPDLWRLA